MELIHIDPAQILIQLAGFGLFVWLLARFAWTPLLTLLDERRRRIEEGFNQIAQGKTSLERLKQELNSRLAAIDDEARSRIQQTVLEGKRIAVEMQEEARAQAQAIIAKSKETIAMELAKANVSLRDELADMTIEAVERLLRQKLDAPSDERLVEDILQELSQPKPQRTAS